MSTPTDQQKIGDKETNTLLSAYLLSAITMNFDGESIPFHDLGAATPWLPMCARGVDLAHITTIGWDISQPTSSIAGTVEDVPDTHIVTLPDLVEVSTMIDLICYCLTSYATN